MHSILSLSHKTQKLLSLYDHFLPANSFPSSDPGKREFGTDGSLGHMAGDTIQEDIPTVSQPKPPLRYLRFYSCIRPYKLNGILILALSIIDWFLPS